jgi:hypothetical protein
MILRVNEDRVVRARSHASLTTNANRFVEINDAVRTFEHRRGGAGGDTRRVRALIATRDLVCTPNLWKHADVDVFHISARY